ncbi:MAG: hypothetical protein FWB72_01745 [Firmicutes bacterium]|nr:hypothetical protein [Bacillota bacterium]
MKNIITFSLVFALGLASVLALPLVTNAYVAKAYGAEIVGLEYKNDKQDLMPLTVRGSRIHDNPYDIVERHVYGPCGRPARFQRETGIVTNADGVPLMNPGNPHITGETTIITYCKYTQSFIDGANRSLALFLDSRLDRHYLHKNGTRVREIRLDSAVFLINFNGRDGQRLIYTFRERYDRGWLNGVFGDRHGYRFFDMNGRRIYERYIAEFQRPAWWRVAIGFAFPPYRLGMGLTGNHLVAFVEIHERTTLGALTTLISHATIHPWDRLRCFNTNEFLLTEDGREVLVNPRTNQVSDFFGFALFNSVNALPIVYHNNDIITTNLEQQRVERRVVDGVARSILVDAFTVWGLLESGTSFYMATVPTHFGYFDVPVLRNNANPHDPDWRLMNGECADGVIKDMRPSEVDDGESFGTWLGRNVNNTRSGLGRVFWGSDGSSGLFGGLANVIAVAGFVLVIFVALMLVGAVREAASPKRREDR